MCLWSCFIIDCVAGIVWVVVWFVVVIIFWVVCEGVSGIWVDFSVVYVGISWVVWVGISVVCDAGCWVVWEVSTFDACVVVPGVVWTGVSFDDLIYNY